MRATSFTWIYISIASYINQHLSLAHVIFCILNGFELVGKRTVLSLCITAGSSPHICATRLQEKSEGASSFFSICLYFLQTVQPANAKAVVTKGTFTTISAKEMDENKLANN